MVPLHAFILKGFRNWLISIFLASAMENNSTISDAFSTLEAPAGNTDCNVYFIQDNENLDIFSDKSGSFTYYTDATRKNINSGIVDVDMEAREGASWFLGIENPDPDDDIYITVEVCALVYQE